MKCPFCKSETRVLNTDKFTCVITRVRRCVTCGGAFTTDEIIREHKEIVPPEPQHEHIAH
jgi:transcriptional regulator NrdR family protein